MSIELILFLVMVGVFFAAAFLAKLPVSISLVLSSLSGIILSGQGEVFRHLIEGSFTYFDTLVLIMAAIVFMKIVDMSGALEALSMLLINKFHKIPWLLLIFLMLLVMLPGAFTGNATISVLTMGPIVGPVLVSMGVPRIKTAAIIAMGAIAGMAAPPVNLPVLIINSGIDMPYIGFGLPLAAITIPPAIFTALWLGYKHSHSFKLETVKGYLDFSLYQKYGLKIFSPFVILLILMLIPRLFAGRIVDLGLPLTFLLASLAGLFSGRKIEVMKLVEQASRTGLPVMGILVGVGMFIQVITLNGVRGFIVVSIFSLPAALQYLGIAISLPLFGAVSSYGAASVLGVPFALALLGGNEIIIVAAMSLVSGLGDLTPPTALAGIFAAQVMKVDDYRPVLKQTLVPALFFLIYGMTFIIFSRFFGFLV